VTSRGSRPGEALDRARGTRQTLSMLFDEDDEFAPDDDDLLEPGDDVLDEIELGTVDDDWED
jgi:hypothetical protein